MLLYNKCTKITNAFTYQLFKIKPTHNNKCQLHVILKSKKDQIKFLLFIARDVLKNYF